MPADETHAVSIHSLTYRHSLPSSVGPCSKTGLDAGRPSAALPVSASRTAETTRCTFTTWLKEVYSCVAPAPNNSPEDICRPPSAGDARSPAAGHYMAGPGPRQPGQSELRAPPAETSFSWPRRRAENLGTVDKP